MSNLIELKQKNKIFNTTWLRSYKGFEDCSVEDAERIIGQLLKLANIVCEHVQKGSRDEDTI